MTHDMQYAAAAAGHSAPLYAEQVRVSCGLHCQVVACAAVWSPACRFWPSGMMAGNSAACCFQEWPLTSPLRSLPVLLLWQLMCLMAAVNFVSLCT